MGKPTEKMLGFLKTKGIDATNWTFEDASAKIGEIKAGKTAEAKTNGKQEYHLTPEECRCRALEASLKTYQLIGLKTTTEQIIATACIYEIYILGKVQ